MPACLFGVLLIFLSLRGGHLSGMATQTHAVLASAAPFAPFSTATVALVAGAIAWRSHRHRLITDRRAEFWRRMQYALDLILTTDDPVARNTGMSLASSLSEDGLFTQRDVALWESTVASLIDQIRAEEARSRSDNAGTYRSGRRRIGGGRRRRRNRDDAR